MALRFTSKTWLHALGALVVSAALSACATGPGAPPPASPSSSGGEPVAQNRLDTYSRDEIIEATSDFFGVTAEAAASTLERVFADLGRPVGYIAGEEVSGAAGVGLRYGEGYLTLKGEPDSRKVYWTGPTIGFDAGGDASKVFTLVYNLDETDRLYQRYPGVEGSAYFIAGLGVHYQRADDVTLAPITSGVGFRAGANVGYVAYSRRRNWIPF